LYTGYARHLLICRHVAASDSDDLTQEVLLTIAQKIGQFPPNGSASGATEQFQWYLPEGASYRKALSAVALPRTKISLAVHFLSADGEVAHSENIDPWTEGQFISADWRRLSAIDAPYFVTPLDIADKNPIQVNATLSPRFARRGGSQTTAAMTGYLNQFDEYPVCENGHCDVIVRPFTIVLPPESLERIK